MRSIKISFADGNVLVAQGQPVDTDIGSVITDSDGQWVEGRESIKVFLLAGFILNDNHEETQIQPGLYRIDAEGLWLHL